MRWNPIAATAWAGLLSGLGYVAGAAGYLAAPTLIAVVAARPAWSAVADTAWPREPERRLVLLGFLLPLAVADRRRGRGPRGDRVAVVDRQHDAVSGRAVVVRRR